MTPDQRKEVTDALVSFVLTVTDSSHLIDRLEAMILPAVLEFLMKTDSSDVLSYPPIEPSSNLYKELGKFIKRRSDNL